MDQPISSVHSPIADLDGINILSSSKHIQNLPSGEIQQMVSELQARYLEVVEELNSTRKELREEASDRYQAYQALFIQHFRVERLMQALQDLHGRDMAERIYKESAPEIKKQISFYQEVKSDLWPQDIIQEFEVLARKKDK